MNPLVRLPCVITRDNGDNADFDLQLDAESDLSLVDAAYKALRDGIIDGRLRGGQKLPQIPIANQLGISRTPVRDALQRLTQEGLVRAVSNRRFEVSRFAAKDVIDIYEVRLILEPFTVRASLPHFSRITFALLEDLCDQTEATPTEDVGTLYRLNADFHRTLIEPCPNRIATGILTRLWEQPSSVRLFHTQAAQGAAMKRSAAEHRLIIDAIRTGDDDLIIERVTQHIRAAETETIAALAEEE